MWSEEDPNLGWEIFVLVMGSKAPDIYSGVWRRGETENWL